MIKIEDKSYNIKVSSRPVVVRVSETGPMVRVSESSALGLPRVIKTSDSSVVVNAVTRPVSLVVKNEVVVLKTLQQPIVAKINNAAARVIAVSKQGLPGPQGQPGDTQVTQKTVTGNGTSAVDSVPIAEAQALDWWVSAEDANGARRSYFVTAMVNTQLDYRKYGNVGAPVAFVSRVEIQGSSVALVVENRSASELIIRTIRLQKRFH